MRVRTAILLTLLVGLGIFSALNWPVFTARTQLNLAVVHVDAPLGLIMLIVTVGVTLLYATLIAWRETSALLESRRYAKALEAQRQLADSAEASRYTQLRETLTAEVAGLRSAVDDRSRDEMQRLDRLEATVGTEIERAGNTLAAYIGELEERLSRGDRPPRPSA